MESGCGAQEAHGKLAISNPTGGFSKYYLEGAGCPRLVLTGPEFHSVDFRKPRPVLAFLSSLRVNAATWYYIEPGENAGMFMTFSATC